MNDLFPSWLFIFMSSLFFYPPSYEMLRESINAIIARHVAEKGEVTIFIVFLFPLSHWALDHIKMLSDTIILD